MNDATVARADSNASVASSAKKFTARCTFATPDAYVSTTRAMTCCGFCVVAALSRYASGRSFTSRLRYGKSPLTFNIVALLLKHVEGRSREVSHEAILAAPFGQNRSRPARGNARRRADQMCQTMADIIQVNRAVPSRHNLHVQLTLAPLIHLEPEHARVLRQNRIDDSVRGQNRPVLRYQTVLHSSPDDQSIASPATSARTGVIRRDIPDFVPDERHCVVPQVRDEKSSYFTISCGSAIANNLEQEQVLERVQAGLAPALRRHAAELGRSVVLVDPTPQGSFDDTLHVRRHQGTHRHHSAVDLWPCSSVFDSKRQQIQVQGKRLDHVWTISLDERQVLVERRVLLGDPFSPERRQFEPPVHQLPLCKALEIRNDFGVEDVPRGQRFERIVEDVRLRSAADAARVCAHVRRDFEVLHPG